MESWKRGLLDAHFIPKPRRGKLTGFTDLQVLGFVEPLNPDSSQLVASGLD
jgi:hypothetical protein